MKHRILIIDDKEQLCTSLQQNFEHVGYDCTYAPTRSDAFRVLPTDPIRAVLLDILKTINERHPSVPVIMITGYGTKETPQVPRPLRG